MLFGIQPFLLSQQAGGVPPTTHDFGSVGTSWTAATSPFTNTSSPAGHTIAADLQLSDTAVDYWPFGSAYKLVTIGQVRAENGAGTPVFNGVTPSVTPTTANLKLEVTTNTVPGGTNLGVRVRVLSGGLNTPNGIGDDLSALTTAASGTQTIAGGGTGAIITWDVIAPIAEAAAQPGWLGTHDLFFFLEVISSSSVPGFFQSWQVDLDNMEFEYAE